jgi:hypothetical protein
VEPIVKNYNSRERIKRRYLKDERILSLNDENSAIRLPGLINAATTHHRWNLFKIPWPFRIILEMFSGAGCGTVHGTISSSDMSGVLWQTFRFPDSETYVQPN